MKEYEILSAGLDGCNAAPMSVTWTCEDCEGWNSDKYAYNCEHCGAVSFAQLDKLLEYMNQSAELGRFVRNLFACGVDKVTIKRSSVEHLL